MRRPLDAEMVRRGLCASKPEALSLIESHQVLVSGSIALKPKRAVDAGEPIFILAPEQFVGRGATKLAGALEQFHLNPTGLNVLDAGASTGGFTDCLLQSGAAAVTALDVGHGQLHERLRADSRVRVLERTNLRDVAAETIGTFDATVADLSFISLASVVGKLTELTTAGGWLVLLVKPQFEADKQVVARSAGVIRDPDVWESTVISVITAACAYGAAMMDVMESPIKGGDGNTEFLLYLAAGATADFDNAELGVDIAASRVAEVVAMAVDRGSQ